MNINGCFNDEWIPLSKNNSTGTDFGMMMIVNNTTATGRLVYKDTVNKQMCPGVVYNAYFAVINIDRPLPACSSVPDFPVFELRIETDAGILIKKDTTRPGIGYAAPTMGYKFAGFGFDFVMPASANRLVIKVNLIPSSALCAEDFAIDDIMIRPVGPKVQIAFANELPTTIVKIVCFQDNQTVSFSGTMGPYYSNPALQWQQTTDDGITWTDIPGETGNNYSRVLSTPDTFLFRLTGGEATNIANPACRVISNFFKVEVDGIPTNYSVTSNSPVCAGQDLKFNGAGGARYIWTGPNGFFDNIPFPHIFFSSLADSGMYYVEIFSAGGCRVKDSVYATVIGTDVNAGPDTAICKGRSVRLNSSTGIKYEWMPATGLSATNVSSPVAKPDVTTEYTVKVMDAFGCSDTAKVQVIITNKIAVNAIIRGTDYLCRLYDSAAFKDMSSGTIVSRRWDFGNGQRDTTSNPPVQYYAIPGNQTNYVARLAVMDAAGCTDTAYHILAIEDNCYIAVPSAFTPNGDGLNDYLYPLNAYKATDLLFRVYNRSGQVVFETRDWTRKWDGTTGGVKQTSEVFIWILNYTDASNKKIKLKGTTLLIR
jgi:gliding motility-associated-like protein